MLIYLLLKEYASCSADFYPDISLKREQILAKKEAVVT